MTNVPKVKFGGEFWSIGKMYRTTNLERVMSRVVWDRASNRCRWIDEQIISRTTGLQRWLMKRFGLFRKLFGWEVRTYTFDYILKDRVEIWHHGRLVIKKEFK